MLERQRIYYFNMDYILKENKDGTKITVKDVQDVLLEMLKDIDIICKKNNIPYFLNGGSALGAYRHKGFIPWDDDADISMLKEDYDRFIKVLEKDLDKSKYTFHCYKKDNRYNPLIPAMKIRKLNTYIKEANFLLKNRITECDGLFIDVFVYDNVSKNKFIDLPFRLFNIILMPLIILFDNIHINPRILKKIFTYNAELYGKINKGSEYIGFDLCWTFKNPLKPFIFKKDDIYPVKYVEFEDTMLPVANNIENYLYTAIAPSYNSLPPLDKRAPKHIKEIEL